MNEYEKSIAVHQYSIREGTMSVDCSTLSSLKESPLHTKISRYLFYFIWMLVDTLFFVLGTVCMILVVSNSETITDYFAGHHNTPTILIRKHRLPDCLFSVYEHLRNTIHFHDNKFNEIMRLI
uniref:Uncharacterized protein n=1 Tax=Trichobilharzia regenti TaxID=157069 RepID=A0AA85J423_TRIRE|nr:unnamed protein product [Trichobilharzia regenti]